MTQVKTTTLDSAPDRFVAARLPSWLQQASVEQINTLRDRYAAHRRSHERLTQALQPLQTPQAYAEAAYSALLDGAAAEAGLAGLQWLDVRRRFTVPADGGLPTDETVYVRSPALLRLMQNFPGTDSSYLGSGLVLIDQNAVLSGDPNAFARRCRELDVGKQYQALLEQQATAQVRTLLAEHKRTGFALAVELAALRGVLQPSQHAALLGMVEPGSGHGRPALHVYPGQLKMLDRMAADGLLMQLRGAEGEDLGVVLYLPQDAEQPLQHFANLSTLNQGLAAELRKATVHRRIGEMIGLRERAAFTATLNKRLLDSDTDLQLQGATLQGDVFKHLADQHILRLKDDARLLLVPNADADASNAHARLARWEGIGMGALGIAGLFVPVLGELLLAQLVVHTVKESYEGVADWAQGHRHEAMEHLLGVAEVVAATAVTVVGAGLVARGFARSGFIDSLQPVESDAQEARLWNQDLTPFEVRPVQPVLQEDGLFTDGDRRLLRIDGRFYEVHQPRPDGPWRLRHRLRRDAFGPELHGNGERYWRLRLEQPMDWDDSSRMLDRLWPSDPPLEPSRAEQVLQAAGMDQNELRGLLVENRPVPFNLRDALSRFEADARIAKLLVRVSQPLPLVDDPQILAWCKTRPGMENLSETQMATRLAQDPASWRADLFAHLSAADEADDPLLAIVERDFPGLPARYAREAVQGLPRNMERVAVLAGRVPLQVADKARSLLAQARVNRAVEGLFLDDSYTAGTGELVFALLRRLPHWPFALNLELREGSDSGRLLATLNPQGQPEMRTVLVQRDGRFRLYDHRGLLREEDVDEPADMFSAVTALLSPAQREALGLDVDHAGAGLRARLIARLPTDRRELLNLLGWREAPPWFNPAMRLSDGRVGYPLGGLISRRQGVVGTFRDRIRALYPSFNEAQVESFLQGLLREEGSPFDHLLQHERNYARLDRALEQWQGAVRNRGVRVQRLHMANMLRAAWRMEGELVLANDGRTGSLRLNLSGWRITQLPALPAEVDLSHVGELILAGQDLEQVPANFLRCFAQLHTLTITNNRLTAIPAGIAHLPALRHLTLMANRIRMTPSNREVLSSLARLHSLNLSHNTLGELDLRFDMPSRLRALRLSFCGLTSVPAGLEQCRDLDFVDLNDNSITDIPLSLRQLPWATRARINFHRNPLPVQVREIFYGIDQHGVIARQAPPVLPAMDRWLQGEPASNHLARSQLWARLRGQAGSGGLFSLLQALTDASDFTREPDYVRDQVWSLLEALDEDQALQRRIFASAVEPQGCVDSVAERFSRLQIEVLVYVAQKSSTETDAQAALLELGRRLFRLERVDHFAFEVVRQRHLAGVQVDDLEVVLGYRIRLAQALHLPCQPRTMRFDMLAAISPQSEQQALATVRAEETPEALAQSLVTRDFWVSYLRTQHLQVFAELDEAFAEQGTQLDEQVEELSSEAYRQQWDALTAEREAARQDLALELTREALSRDQAELGQTAHRD